MSSRRFQTFGVGAAVALGLLWLLSQSFSVERDYSELEHQYAPPAPAQHGAAQSHHPAPPAPPPLRRRHVSFASSFIYHGDVYMTLAKSMGDLFDRDHAPATINVFAQPFTFGFQEIVEELNLWTHPGIRAEHERFIDHLNSQTGDGAVDLVVLGTCQYDLPYFHEDLKSAWERRDAEHKFNIVCYVHHTTDMDWKRWLPWWSQRNAIRLVAISQHVAAEFQSMFEAAADSRDPELSGADFEHVAVDVHVPVVAVPNLPVKPAAKRHLSKAVIQGKFEFERRDYSRIFSELVQSLRDDPAVWGYLPLNGEKAFRPDEHSPVPPFQLLLVGSQYLGFPDELENIVVIYRDLPYKGFYDIIADCDIVVPAFADDSYFKTRASSTIALATELNVPMLVTNRIRKTYGFIDDDRVVVTRPALMGEVAALRALRLGDTSAFLDAPVGGSGLRAGEMPAVRAGVERMLREGWVRDERGFAAWREAMWERNRDVARRMLNDLP